MNLHHLKYFFDAARLNSISKAAKGNLVGQPAISKAIKSLEDELGVKLILHERNRFNLTDEGVNAYKYGQGVFDSIEKLKDSLDSKSLVTGEVLFACQSSMAESAFLSKAIKKIINKYPGLYPNLSLGRTDLVRSWLQAGKIDLAIVINNRDFNDFHAELVSTGNFYLVKGKDYKGNWKSQGILATDETKELTQLRHKFLTLNEHELKNQMMIGSWGVIKNFALQGIGVGFVPDYLIQKEIKNGQLKYVEKNKYSVPYEIIIITPKNKYISSKVKIVINEILHKKID
jgi:DNA-binding transcriptional LysR family regulator